MSERNVSRQYQICICGEKPEEIDVLNIPTFNNTIDIGSNNKMALWEADYLTSGYKSQAKFMEDINQILTFKPVNVKLGPLESRYRSIIFNDPTINYIAGEISKINPSAYKNALVDRINKDGDNEYGKKVLEELKTNLKDATGNPEKLSIMAAIYNSKLTDYHLSFLMLYSYNLRSACNYTIPDREGLGNEGMYETAINQYSNFREAYIFYERFKNDYDKIKALIGNDVIKGAIVIPDDLGTGYKYKLKLQIKGEMIISSNQPLLNERTSNNPLHDYKKIETVAGNNPLDPNDSYSVPDESYEMLEEELYNTDIKEEPSVKEELNRVRKVSGISTRNRAKRIINHEDPLDDYAIGDEEIEQREEKYRESVESYLMMKK